MARLRSLLGTLKTLFFRDWGTLSSFQGNNLFTLGIALLFLGAGSFLFFAMVLMGLVLIFPASASILRKIPEERWSVWPLRKNEKLFLQLAGIAMNPLIWLVILLVLWGKVSWEILLTIAMMPFIGFLLTVSKVSVCFPAWLRLPSFPWRLNQLLRKNLREISSTLDFYCASGFALVSALVRLNGNLPDEALLPLSLLIVLIMSTYAQNLFGLDGAGGMVRYSLLPVQGWMLLVAKDVVVLMVVFLLTLSLNLIAGMCAALMMLAVGHAASVRKPIDQMRWRFQSGGSFASGILQMLLLIFAGFSAGHFGVVFLVPCAILYFLSISYCGKLLRSF